MTTRKRGLRTKRTASHATQISIDLRKLGFGSDRGSYTALPSLARFRRSNVAEAEGALKEPERRRSGHVDAFAVDDVAAAEPVLLVDDLVDSRWALMVVAAGPVGTRQRPVSPFVHAQSVSD